ncbi:MAG: SMP-30/gluconolactonase/LRE family protein, partial [Flavisolibacter sp.]|nr:SMP-30/gluconolactonase/LRE family protein [Flavisolibacter sp.]
MCSKHIWVLIGMCCKAVREVRLQGICTEMISSCSSGSLCVPLRSKVFYSAAGYGRKLQGLPDGLKIDKKGNVFATRPGGIYIFNSQGKLLGMLKLPEATSNVALSADEKT